VVQACRGTEIVTSDCASAGALCGADPASPYGAACVKKGDLCGRIDGYGACEGTVLAYCSNPSATLRVVDCAGEGGQCAFVSAARGFDCVTTCGQADVSAGGRCDGSAAVTRCVYKDGIYRVETETCALGTECRIHAETFGAGCVPKDSCGGVGPQGRCGGNTLTRCVGGARKSVDCGDDVCAYGGDAEGYVCASRGAVGALLVAGMVRFEDRPPIPDGLGAPTPVPARGVSVALVADGDGAVLAAALTDDEGGYRLHVDAAKGTLAHVVAATTSVAKARPLRVLRPDDLVHGVGSPSFALAERVTQDLLVTERSGVAQAFNIFDNLVSGLDYVRLHLGVAEPQALYAVWVRGTGEGTYYAMSMNGIFLLGDIADDDGYDDTVILHELGHYVEDAYGRSDSRGGAHAQGGIPSDPRTAMSEGFATYFASAVRGDPAYMDSNVGGGWYLSIDDGVTMVPNPRGDMTQSLSEDTVSEILWDAADASMSDDDPLVGDAAAVLLIERDYFRGPSGDRGVSGVDLVDWLDGWFARMGMDGCQTLRAIVTEKRGFPYDYMPPAGACFP
jgi:hypothetical protein